MKWTHGMNQWRGNKDMTKKEFMTVVGIFDPNQLKAIMLLGGDEEPRDGDWTGIMRKWYGEMVERSNKYETLYHRLSRSAE